MLVKRRRKATAALAVGLMLVVSACSPGEGSPSSVARSNPTGWAAPTPSGADRAVVYVTRGAGLDDPIIEATVEPGIAGGADTGATVTTLHKDGHLGHLDRPQENPTTAVATGETVILTGLAHPLAAGDRFRLTLRLKSGTKLDVDVTVAQRQPI